MPMNAEAILVDAIHIVIRSDIHSVTVMIHITAPDKIVIL